MKKLKNNAQSNETREVTEAELAKVGGGWGDDWYDDTASYAGDKGTYFVESGSYENASAGGKGTYFVESGSQEMAGGDWGGGSDWYA